MIVVDASAVLEFIGGTEHGRVVAARIRAVPFVNAPHFIDLEVLNVLRRQVRLANVSSIRARQMLDDFLDVRMDRHEHTPLVGRIWDLRHNYSAYDACYLALAEALCGTLLTRDGALGKAKLRRGHVEVI